MPADGTSSNDESVLDIASAREGTESIACEKRGKAGGLPGEDNPFSCK